MVDCFAPPCWFSDVHFNLDPFEGNAPASRPNKKSPKKDKKNPVYSTPKKPKKKKRIIYEYEDEPEGI